MRIIENILNIITIHFYINTIKRIKQRNCLSVAILVSKLFLNISETSR